MTNTAGGMVAGRQHNTGTIARTHIDMQDLGRDRERERQRDRETERQREIGVLGLSGLLKHPSPAPETYLSNKATSPNPSLTFLLIEDLAFKFMSLWRPFSSKPLHLFLKICKNEDRNLHVSTTCLAVLYLT